MNSVSGIFRACGSLWNKKGSRRSSWTTPGLRKTCRRRCLEERLDAHTDVDLRNEREGFRPCDGEAMPLPEAQSIGVVLTDVGVDHDGFAFTVCLRLGERFVFRRLEEQSAEARVPEVRMHADFGDFHAEVLPTGDVRMPAGIARRPTLRRDTYEVAVTPVDLLADCPAGARHILEAKDLHDKVAQQRDAAAVAAGKLRECGVIQYNWCFRSVLNHACTLLCMKDPKRPTTECG